MEERINLLTFLQSGSDNKEQYNKLIEKYIQKTSKLIFLTDHSIVRYLERVKGLTLSGKADIRKVQQYLRKYQVDANELRAEMLNKEEMLHILKNNIVLYPKGDFTYVFENLTLITILKRTNKHEETSGFESQHKEEGDSRTS